MRMITTASIFALAALAAAPALAQDERPPFTGVHIEALAGYDNVQSGDDNSNDAAEGVAYGAALGYDMQMGGVILGIEGEYAGSSGHLTAHDLDLTGDALRLDVDRDLYIGGRIGVVAGPSTLVYLKGGYTNLRVQSRYTNSTGTIFDQGVTLDGWRAGIGVEQRFSLLGPSGFIKAEYRYSNYHNLDLGNVNANIDTDRHQVMAGVGVRF